MDDGTTQVSSELASKRAKRIGRIMLLILSTRNVDREPLIEVVKELKSDYQEEVKKEGNGNLVNTFEIFVEVLDGVLKVLSESQLK